MNQEIKCLAIDDEPLALEVICDYIKRVPFLKLINTFDNALDAISFLSIQSVDLLFLDIQMEGLTGIQLLRALSSPPEVIFTTAYDQYAVEGFELNAADYLMKPISFERFIKAVDRAYDIIAKQEFPTEDRKERDPFVFIKTENRLEKILFDQILFIEGQGDYLRIVLPDKRIMTLMRFSQLEEILPADQFVRVHKSFLVAIDKIVSVARNRIRIGEALIPISDSYRKDFYERITPGSGRKNPNS